MKFRPIPLIAAAAICAGAVAVAIHQTSANSAASYAQDPERYSGNHPDGAARTIGNATPVEAPSAILLTVELDANGAKVVQLTRKPDEPFQHPFGWHEMPFGWVMRDANGLAIEEGGFDPGPVDLDPAHFGQPGTYMGDVHIPTATATLVAIPALAEFASIELFRREGQTRTRIGAELTRNITTR